MDLLTWIGNASEISTYFPQVKYNYNNYTESPFLHFNEELKTIRPIFVILQSTIGLVTIIASLTTLALFSGSKCTSNANKGSSRKFFIALTMADLQCGIICTISFNVVVKGMRINDPYCMIAVSAVYYSLYVTFFMLVAMTIDRYIAIMYPEQYMRWSTIEMFFITVVLSWFGGGVLGFCVYYTCLASSPHPEVLCLVTIERTNETLTIIIIFLVNIPCTLFILYSFIRIFKVIMRSVSNITICSKKCF